MAFNTFQFFCFFPVVILGYFLVPKRTQWVWLLLASLTFYLFAGPEFIFFVLVTAFTTYWAANAMGKLNIQLQKQPNNQKLQLQNNRRKKQIIVFTLILNFGILAFLKYYNFLTGSFNGLLNNFFHNSPLPSFSLLLPMGISFYTFQTIGYVIDIYRDTYAPQRNFAKYLLFVSFFPQMMEGPIGRYDALAEQLYAQHDFDMNRFVSGLELMLWGYFKKMVIADRAGILVTQVFNNYEDYAGFQIAIAAVFFAVQLYTDFSGYIDIATGVAQILGIRLAINFERPYFSKDVAEFWRRWHITLGTWFKDYLFYPLMMSSAFANLSDRSKKLLGKKKGKQVPTFCALAVVWATTGLWHGAAWHYVIWGLYYGVLIILSMMLKPFYKWLICVLHVNTACWSYRAFQTLRTFALVCVGYMFFEAKDLVVAGKMIWSMFSTWNPWIFFDNSLYSLGLDEKDFHLTIVLFAVLLIASLLQRNTNLREQFAKQNLIFRWGICAIAVCVIVIYGCYGAGYNAADFIYAKF